MEETATKEAQTFELEVSRTVIDKVQVPLPHYRKKGKHAYKVFSPEDCIQVWAGYRPSITVTAASLAWHLEGGEEITAEEFNSVYAQTVSEISGIVAEPENTL